MVGEPIDITAKLEALIRDIGERVGRLRHVRDAAITCLVRVPRQHTLCRAWAQVFYRTRSRDRWEALRTAPYIVGGTTANYVVVFDVRALLREPSELRLWTVFHELWHLHPEADGRRRALRHGHRFDAAVASCLSTYRALAPPAQYEWLLGLRNGSTITARTVARGKWPRRRRWQVAWDVIAREVSGSPHALDSLYGAVPTACATITLDASSAQPRYAYRCAEGHEVRTWGKFRIVRACGRCHRERGALTPLVLSAPSTAG